MMYRQKAAVMKFTGKGVENLTGGDYFFELEQKLDTEMQNLNLVTQDWILVS